MNHKIYPGLLFMLCTRKFCESLCIFSGKKDSSKIRTCRKIRMTRFELLYFLDARSFTILGALATIPYIIFILFTMASAALLRPKNVFKSNFAFSAIVNLVRSQRKENEVFLLKLKSSKLIYRTNLNIRVSV